MAATQAIERLQATVTTPVRAEFDSRTGAVRRLSASEGFLSPPSRRSPETIASGFLAEYHDVFGLTQDDLRYLVKTREARILNDILTVLSFSQVVSGVPVFESEIRVQIRRSGEVFLVSSSAVPLPQPVNNQPSIAPEQAIVLATANVRPDVRFVPQVKSVPVGPEQKAEYEAGPFRSDITVRLVFFPVSGDLRLAWEVYLLTAGPSAAYDILVDAVDGRILLRRNRVADAAAVISDGRGNVLHSNDSLLGVPRPDPFPIGDCRLGPPLNHRFRSLNNGFLNSDSVLFPSSLDKHYLAGNNVHVYRADTTHEGAEGFADSDSNGQRFYNFDFFKLNTFNSDESAETNLFFAINFLHDFFYNIGFNEQWNFQETNFTAGTGLGADSVMAVARATGTVDYPGRNNAYFYFAADGRRPRLEIGLFDGQKIVNGKLVQNCWKDGNGDVRGEYDLDLVTHEYHHGVADRLGLPYDGAARRAMHEGGGDYFAYSTDNDTRMAQFAFWWTDGVRRVNNKTYAHWLDTPLFRSPRSDYFNGEIWANVLWDLRQRFQADGIPVSWMEYLYIEALVSQPTTMPEVRDAMVQMDVLTGGADFCRIWETFADRGLGVFAASTTQADGTVTVTADSTVPPACQPVPAPLPPRTEEMCDVFPAGAPDGKVDMNDIAAILRARGQAAGYGDRRDADGDGVITINDASFCRFRIP